jgi:hypothetical protein
MCIESHLDNYLKVKSRAQKSKIVTAIVLNIRKAAAQSGGGFVRKVRESEWFISLVYTIIESHKPYILAPFLSIQDLLTRRWFKVGDKLAREKVGQALRDAIKTRRASGKKQVADDVKKASSDPSGLKNRKEQTIVHLPTSKTMVPLQNKREAVDLQESNRMFCLNSSALPSSALINSFRVAPQNFGHNASSLYFDNQLSADLEPTPIQIQSTMRLPDLFDRGNMSNIRNQAATSSRLRFYDIDGRRASLTHHIVNSSNRDSCEKSIGLTTEPAKLPTAIDSLGPICPSTPRSRSYPSYAQRMLPSVIERRRHSLVGSGFDGDMSFHPIDHQGNPILSLKNECQNMVDTRLVRASGSAPTEPAVWDDLLGRITTHSKHQA